jgi:hypothetical protein
MYVDGGGERMRAHPGSVSSGFNGVRSSGWRICVAVLFKAEIQAQHRTVTYVTK